MRGTLLLIAALATGCISSRVGPVLFREDWSQPRREADPTRSPTEPEAVNPWGGEDQATGSSAARRAPTRVKRSRKRDLAERSAGTFLGVVVGGWSALLGLTGEFEEDPNARARLRDQPPPPAER